MEKEQDYKQQDLDAVVSFLSGKGSVPVDRIFAESGAEHLRIYPILLQLKFSGRLQVLKETDYGAPAVVSLVEN